ncbi:response regulator [Phaeovulum vinaykumarii]|uniref:Two component transcriptional regulator, winged helix family n=1 Tax=Phaeovulum vinaykumarii TaxID=407234 RepID=A0A1N7MNJ4_9RHOB|nr:response regulator [Phaeovulum vinaykumarii]SIS87511.1 two component transcriptional regulator, winged helix family [Phaeovulum vinaykumarii]SOC13108.1 winged helix family two component transcriptional regulator [Phaeovulum vinaykumarii]
MQAPAHILIVDDDERIRELLRKFLVRNDFLVTVGRDAAHARRLVAGLEFSLIVLDVMMPGEDGISLTRDLRARLATPILLLTARGETHERIEGLEAGADDYLAKPFDPRELLARINAILRRVPPETPREGQPLTFGGLRYDAQRGELCSEQGPVRLTATEAALMRIFAARAGEVVSRAELIEDLGRERGLSEEGGDEGGAQARAIDVQITRLRRKIEPDPREPRYLQTVRGAGYVFSPE